MSTFFNGRARSIKIPAFNDSRGRLLPIDFSKLPFTPCRSFIISEVPPGAVRGGHAHRTGQQLLLCPAGRIEILLRADKEEVTIQLEISFGALHLGPGVWSQQIYLDKESVLVAFASEPYDSDVYMQQST